nr:NADPH-dependent diflavin oxidoreductase 1 isoform X2 [Tanacetum cinerariifolium]
MLQQLPRLLISGDVVNSKDLDTCHHIYITFFINGAANLSNNQAIMEQVNSLNTVLIWDIEAQPNYYVVLAPAESHVDLVAMMSFLATGEHDKHRIQYFASPQGQDDMYQSIQKEWRTVLEVLSNYGTERGQFK